MGASRRQLRNRSDWVAEFCTAKIRIATSTIKKIRDCRKRIKRPPLGVGWGGRVAAAAGGSPPGDLEWPWMRISGRAGRWEATRPVRREGPISGDFAHQAEDRHSPSGHPLLS